MHVCSLISFLFKTQSVTAFGRQMIAHSKEIVEAQYCVAKGYEYDAKVCEILEHH